MTTQVTSWREGVRLCNVVTSWREGVRLCNVVTCMNVPADTVHCRVNQEEVNMAARVIRHIPGARDQTSWEGYL